MSDGIIQEVIEKWFMSNLFPNGVLTHELTYTDILILQGKLIEKIKQYPLYGSNVITRKDLIGDNKE